MINMLWAIDISLNVIMGGRRETISARIGRHRNKNKVFGIMCDALDRIDPGHCEDSRDFWDRTHEKGE